MLARISTALLAFIFIAMASLHGHDQPATTDTSGPITTDRPAVTNSSVVVPSGSLQAVNGFLETGNQGQSIFDGPEALVRLGVATKTDLRFTAPDYYCDPNAVDRRSTGLGDLGIGVKQQLGPTPGGFDVSAILLVNFPTGADGVSSGGYDRVYSALVARTVR